MFYHVVANIDTRFNSMEEALRVYNTNTVVTPYIPDTCAEQEDKATPRIPVAKAIEDCITSIGVIGRFRRCCANNEDAKSYEAEGKEAYPLLLLTFSIDEESVYIPSVGQVPDVEETNERWFLTPTAPSSVDVIWVYPESIHYHFTANSVRVKHLFVCDEFRFSFAFPDGRHHPWIDGKGNVLESSELYRE